MSKSKKQLSNLHQTNGRDETKTKKFTPTTLEQFWGEKNGSERYHTMDSDEYERYINEDLNSAELRQHAVEVAHIAPSTSIERTKNRLILEHKKYIAGFTQEEVILPKNKPASKELLKIMSDVK